MRKADIFKHSFSRLVFVLLLICCITGATQISFAQETLTSDSTSSLRAPSNERLLEISQNPDYNYRETQAELSLWDRFMMWLRNLLGEWLQEKYVEWFLKITAGIAFISVLYLLINQISKGELRSALAKRRDRTLLDLNLKAVTETDSKLDELLQKALEKKNYSLAVRYLYQKSIVLLKEQGLINWKADKTNHDFLFELGNHPVAIPFDRLTYFHEYVDYGDFKIDERRYHTIQKVFEEFKKLIQKTE